MEARNFSPRWSARKDESFLAERAEGKPFASQTTKKRPGFFTRP
jgi:hypothetical protein